MPRRALEGLPNQPPDRRHQFRRIPGRFAFQPRHFPPCAVNNHRGRQAPCPQGPRRCTAWVEPDGEFFQAKPLIKGFHLRPPAAIRRKRQHRNAFRPQHGLQPVERGHFRDTWRAPSGPKIDHQPLPGKSRQARFLAIGIGKGNRRRRRRGCGFAQFLKPLGRPPLPRQTGRE